MKRTWKKVVLLLMAALWMFCVTVGAEGASGDNSLYSLGLENASSCSPEFYYSTLEYNVTVPAGTKELYLSPVTSDSSASILDISGTMLDESGKGTVYITVEAPNGAQVSYVLYVTADGAAEETETEAAATESTEDKEAAREAELKAQAESEAALRREAELKAKEEQITKLSTENEQIVDRMNLLLKVLYGLVAFAVILLFFIINQSLRNKDLKDDLKEARMEAGDSYEFARKDQNMRTDYYYAPVNAVPQNQTRGTQTQRADANNMQAVFGNVPPRTQAQQPVQPQPQMQQPMQQAPVQQPYAPAMEQRMPAEEEPQMSAKEMKKMEKAERKAAKKAEKEGRKAASQPQPQMQQPMQQAPMQQPMQPSMPQQPMQDTYVQSTFDEPDVDVDMIEL